MVAYVVQGRSLSFFQPEIQGISATRDELKMRTVCHTIQLVWKTNHAIKSLVIWKLLNIMYLKTYNT